MRSSNSTFCYEGFSLLSSSSFPPSLGPSAPHPPWCPVPQRPCGADVDPDSVLPVHLCRFYSETIVSKMRFCMYQRKYSPCLISWWTCHPRRRLSLPPLLSCCHSPWGFLSSLQPRSLRQLVKHPHPLTCYHLESSRLNRVLGSLLVCWFGTPKICTLFLTAVSAMLSFASSGFPRLQTALIFCTSIRRTRDESPQCPCAPHRTQGPGRTTPPSPGHTAWWPGPGSGLTRLLAALGLGKVIVVLLVNSLASAQHSSASSTVPVSSCLAARTLSAPRCWPSLHCAPS